MPSTDPFPSRAGLDGARAPARIEAVLRERGLLPDTVLAAWVGGSLARGWGHQLSDLDLFVVSTDPWTGGGAEQQRVDLDPPTVPLLETHVDGLRWEIRYWQEAQANQLVDRVSWDEFEAGRISLTAIEAVFLERVMHAAPVLGVSWIERSRERVEQTALRAFLTTRALARYDSSVEDAVGLVEAGADDGAVLAVQTAFASIVDALTWSLGEFGQETKWRARRMRILDPRPLPFDRYWEVVTMRSFDPDDPEAWVRSVVELCRRVALEIEIG